MTYSIKRDDAYYYYVYDHLSGECVSPPMPTRERAWQLMQEIIALGEREQRLIRAGRRPAPGCDWLIAAGRRVS